MKASSAWGRLALVLLLGLVACSGSRARSSPSPDLTGSSQATARTLAATTPAASPAVDVSLTAGDVTVAPLPLRAGSPFTVTVDIRNAIATLPLSVPVMLHITPLQEQLGYQPFLQVFTVTLPSTLPVSVPVPVHWNLNGGEHRLWLQVNHIPEAWLSQAPVQAEADLTDNQVVQELMVQPFDAYDSDLCSGRVDVEIDPAGVRAQAGLSQVRVGLRNQGNRALYNLPVVVLGQRLSGIAYTPALPPCGGTAEVAVELDRPLQSGETLSVEVNPPGWEGGTGEDDHADNRLAVQAGAAAAGAGAPGELVDYDFSLSAADLSSPEPWILQVTVRNLGTRDAARVPIRVVSQSGRKITDAIPLVQGEGLGIAALRVGYLWTRGGILTITVNPPDLKGAYPEADYANNMATYTLP